MTKLPTVQELHAGADALKKLAAQSGQATRLGTKINIPCSGCGGVLAIAYKKEDADSSAAFLCMRVNEEAGLYCDSCLSSHFYCGACETGRKPTGVQIKWTYADEVSEATVCEDHVSYVYQQVTKLDGAEIVSQHLVWEKGSIWEKTKLILNGVKQAFGS